MAEALGLENLKDEEWDVYMHKLAYSNIILKEEGDILLKSKKNFVGGFYTTKLGYKEIFLLAQGQTQGSTLNIAPKKP